jgi:quercetin dioxygenase-like cupin family protein
MTKLTLGLAVILAFAGSTTGARTSQGAQPTFARTMLQDQDLSVKDRHGVMARSEFMPGATSGRHFHPGEEFGYVLEGTLELTVDGKPAQRLNAGSVIFMPAGTIHEAKNVGTGSLKVLSTYVLEKGKPLATAVK